MEVKYLEHMGSDLACVNAARVSFSSESDWEYNQNDAGVDLTDPKLGKRDTHLIKFLARGCTTKDWEELVEEITTCGERQSFDDFACYPVTKGECRELDRELRKLLNHVKRMPCHWVPFANGGQIKLHFKVPLFVARQLQKHTAGFNPWSEVSRRYVDSDPEFYTPEVWRGRSADKKQGSSGVVEGILELEDGPYFTPEDGYGLCKEMYEMLLLKMVAPEQARMVLPQSMYTEFVWSGNLYAWASLYNTRSWGDSQAETAQVAEQIKAIVEPLFPVSWGSLTQ